MPADDDKVFDVSKPHKTTPSATSRPIIVGHHPMMNDPMVRDDSAVAVTHHSHAHHPAPVAENDVSPKLAPAFIEPAQEHKAAETDAPAMPASPIVQNPENPEPPAPTNPVENLPAEPAFTPVEKLLASDATHPPAATMVPHPNNEHLSDNSHLVIPIGHPPHSRKRKKLLWLVIILAVIVGAYLAIDARLIKTSINLPFHIFKQPVVATPIVTTSTPVQTAPTVSTNPYAGWKSYCSDYGGICLKYPSDWQLASKTIPSQTESKANTAQVDVTSPLGMVNVEYVPSAVYPLSQAQGTFSTEVLSIGSTTETTDFKVVQYIESYTQKSTTTISANYYITSNTNVQTYGLEPGTQSKDLGHSLFFVNSKSKHSSSTQDNYQVINVGLAKNRDNGNYATFASTAEAQAWLNSDEVKIAGQILASVNYQ